MPNYSNMSCETQGFVLFDNVTSHVTILNLVISPKSCLFLKPMNVKLFTTCYMSHKLNLLGHDVTSHVTFLNIFFEIIDTINRLAVCSSDFTWPNHLSCVYNNMYVTNVSYVCTATASV